MSESKKKNGIKQSGGVNHLEVKSCNGGTIVSEIDEKHVVVSERNLKMKIFNLA